MANLPNEAQLKAAFQSVEDFWSVNAATLKAGMETALGRPITNPMARKLGKAWLRWKFLQGG